MNQRGAGRTNSEDTSRRYYGRESCLEEATISSETSSDSEEKDEISLHPDIENKNNVSPPCTEEATCIKVYNQCSKYSTLLFFTVIIACAITIYFIRSELEQISKFNFNSLNMLKKCYPQQLDLTWKIVSNSIKKYVTSNNPGSPSILILISIQNATCITSCLAHNLSSLIANVYDDSDITIINGLELHKDGLKTKKEIADTLIMKGHHVILVENLDHIPAASASVLHGFCDHETSPSKQGFFIMTISSENKLPSVSSKEFDNLAFKKLEIAWQEIGEDKLYALLSRICISVAVIQPGYIPSYCSCSVLD